MKVLRYSPPHSKELLKLYQELPLKLKIKKSLTHIKNWYSYFKGNIVVSYSGGKDSTVLLHMVRSIYPEVPAVFVNTGLEFPEVVEHVKQTENTIILKPKMTFREVLKEHGVCFPSKDVAGYIFYARQGKKWALDRLNGVNSNGEISSFRQRYVKYKYLLDAPFKISAKCCYILKESPLDQFQKMNKSGILIATLASESVRRKNAWIQSGCNIYDAFNPSSKPLSFWTEQDILEYIYINKITIPAVYGEIKQDKGKFTLTGEKRTGCMFCLIGCHLDEVNKFERMKEMHPSHYKYCMEVLHLKEILNWLNIRS